MPSVNPRKAAYQALLAFHRNQTPVITSLEEWQAAEKPERRDFALAHELSCGCVRQALSLDYLVAQLTQGRTKRRERMILHLGLYQLYWMSGIPPHAVVHSMVALAKTELHASTGRLINGVLRTAERQTPHLPTGDSVGSLSIRHSLPEFFVEKVLKAYEIETSQAIFEASNIAPPSMLRLRPGVSCPANLDTSPELPSDIALVQAEDIPHFAANADVYIQNASPAHLVAELARKCPEPKSVLDLCASPGGKLLAVHDAFPSAKLTANDVSEKKLKRLHENAKKYSLECTFTVHRAEDYPDGNLFDLIIADVPCSNTGVLAKRPEARWRLQPEQLDQLLDLQRKILKRARELLSPQGQLWLMTCSILPEENEELIDWAKSKLGLSPIADPVLLTPNTAGWDGGFGCALTLS